MTMRSYQIQLRETRLAVDGTDDVALFDVMEEDGETWLVPVFLTPLFRLVHMEAGASPETRQNLVTGLGARAIAERLKGGVEPSEEPLVFTLDYPGAPEEPDPLLPYEDVTVYVKEEEK